MCREIRSAAIDNSSSCSCSKNIGYTKNSYIKKCACVFVCVCVLHVTII